MGSLHRIGDCLHTVSRLKNGSGTKIKLQPNQFISVKATLYGRNPDLSSKITTDTYETYMKVLHII